MAHNVINVPSAELERQKEIMKRTKPARTDGPFLHFALKPRRIGGMRPERKKRESAKVLPNNSRFGLYFSLSIGYNPRELYLKQEDNI